MEPLTDSARVTGPCRRTLAGASGNRQHPSCAMRVRVGVKIFPWDIGACLPCLRRAGVCARACRGPWCMRAELKDLRSVRDREHGETVDDAAVFKPPPCALLCRVPSNGVQWQRVGTRARALPHAALTLLERDKDNIGIAGRAMGWPRVARGLKQGRWVQGRLAQVCPSAHLGGAACVGRRCGTSFLLLLAGTRETWRRSGRSSCRSRCRGRA